jgi:hypothetical protein
MYGRSQKELRLIPLLAETLPIKKQAKIGAVSNEAVRFSRRLPTFDCTLLPHHQALLRAGVFNGRGKRRLRAR